MTAAFIEKNRFFPAAAIENTVAAVLKGAAVFQLK
jgi:hypothetical protein